MSILCKIIGHNWIYSEEIVEFDTFVSNRPRLRQCIRCGLLQRNFTIGGVHDDFKTIIAASKNILNNNKKDVDKM